MSHEKILFAALSAALLLSGCERGGEEPPTPEPSEPASESAGAPAKDAPKEETPEVTPSKKGERGEAPEKKFGAALAGAARAHKSAPVVEAAPARPQDVSSLAWGVNGELLIGFRDGHLATVDVAKKEARVAKVSKDAAPVAAVSPDGAMALLEAEPPRLIKVADQSDILSFSYLDELQGVAFTPDGASMLLASNEGPMRVWKEANKLSDQLAGEVKLQDYVFRMQGDLKVNFGPMASQLAAAAGPTVAYVEPGGQIVWWDMRKPTEALYVLWLEPPVTSMALIGEHLVATSANGDMRVSVIQERNMERWSMTQKAHLVAGDPAEQESFVALHSGALARHRLKDGEVLWDRPLEVEAERLCGLAVNSEQGAVALCQDGVVSLYDFASGADTGMLQRQGEEIVWR